MNISLLAAYTKKNRIIGLNGKIPWKLPSERNRFKQICCNKFVIMGRKTFDEIGKALPYCTIVILSKKDLEVPKGCLLANSLTDGISLIQEKENSKETEILIAGGQEIYEQSLPLANKIYATEIEKDFDGDRFFPELNSEWKKISSEEKEELGIKYYYVEYEKSST